MSIKILLEHHKDPQKCWLSEHMGKMFEGKRK